MDIPENIWIVVKNNPCKYDPQTATMDYVVSVSNEDKFTVMLWENSQVAYRVRNYGDLFNGWDKLPVRHI